MANLGCTGQEAALNVPKSSRVPDLLSFIQVDGVGQLQAVEKLIHFVMICLILSFRLVTVATSQGIDTS